MTMLLYFWLTAISKAVLRSALWYHRCPISMQTDFGHMRRCNAINWENPFRMGQCNGGMHNKLFMVLQVLCTSKYFPSSFQATRTSTTGTWSWSWVWYGPSSPTTSSAHQTSRPRSSCSHGSRWSFHSILLSRINWWFGKPSWVSKCVFFLCRPCCRTARFGTSRRTGTTGSTSRRSSTTASREWCPTGTNSTPGTGKSKRSTPL